MPDWRDLAAQLEEALGLDVAPVAITFGQAAPEGVRLFDAPMPAPNDDGMTGRVPAGCVFWMLAAERTFTTVPADHGNCSVGQYTHGMIDWEALTSSGDVATLLECGWVTVEAAQQLPHVEDAPAYVTYGPLAETPVDPDVVFLRIDASQLMVVNDAFPDMRLEGKPQCHIIAIAQQGEVATSLGCAVSRVRTGMPASQMTCAIPASRLAEAVQRIAAVASGDDVVMRYAADDAERFGALSL
ncbi:MAG: DUF169 domain-containing protein [Acidimicrobiia bacterium]|nr:DUF169 domain-containing protein [Acidimicrobiia bacterium]